MSCAGALRRATQVVLLGLLALPAACGQKGALYLPEKPQPVPPQQPAPSPPAPDDDAQ
jgi:predicted small lipoprotein YifL